MSGKNASSLRTYIRVMFCNFSRDVIENSKIVKLLSVFSSLQVMYISTTDELFNVNIGTPINVFENNIFYFYPYNLFLLILIIYFLIETYDFSSSFQSQIFFWVFWCKTSDLYKLFLSMPTYLNLDFQSNELQRSTS